MGVVTADALEVDLLSRVMAYLDLPSLADLSTFNRHFAAAVSRRLQTIDSPSVLRAIAGQPSVSAKVTNCTLHFCQDDFSSILSEMRLDSLKHLDLSACQWLDDACVTALAHHTGSLEYLGETIVDYSPVFFHALHFQICTGLRPSSRTWRCAT